MEVEIMLSLRRTTLDGRSAKRLLLTPAIGLALVVGAAPATASAAPSKAQGCAKKDSGKAADHRPAGVGGGRRIR
jgi:hypothetical protein